MDQKDRISGAVLLGVAMFFGVAASALPRVSAADITGPKFYPLALSVILAFLSVLLILGKGHGGGGIKLSHKALISGFPPMIGICVLYAILLPRLGFGICTFSLLLASFFLKGERRWGLNIGIAICTTSVIFVLFATLLNVPLKLLPTF